MKLPRKETLVVALFGLAWAALAVAAVGALLTPRRYCGTLGEPAGQSVNGFGLLVALIAVALLFFTLDRYLLLGLWVATLAAAGGVLVLDSWWVISSWCG
jgi:hypothetical protein